MKFKFIVFISLVLFPAMVFGYAKIAPDLAAQMAGPPDKFVRVNLYMEQQGSRDYLKQMTAGMERIARRQFVVDYLKELASSTQANIRNYLNEKEKEGSVTNIRIIWLVNSINFQAQPEVIYELERIFPEINHISWDREIPIEELMDDLGSSANMFPVSPAVVDEIAWGVQNINAPSVWAMGFTGQGVIVANIDTGTNYNHPDLADHIWINVDEIPNNNIDDDNNGYVDDWRGWDFSSWDNDPMDTNGHGTNTSGIVAGDGTMGNQTGVAPDATLMILRNDNGGEAMQRLAIQYAVENGADVVTSSLSWKYPFNPDYVAFRRATDMELAAGMVHSNSIGNQGNQLVQYPIPYNIATPGNCPPPWLHPDQTLIGGVSAAHGCGAYSSNLVIMYYSGVGPAAWEQPTFPPQYQDYPYFNGAQMGLLKPDLSAPTNVMTTNMFGGYSNGFSGTSAATPHLGGSFALLLSAVPDATPEEISQVVQLSAIEAGTPGKDNLYGAGRLDVYGALQMLLTSPNTNVVITLQPESLPITIPANGGSFNFTVNITNEGTGVAFVDAWTEAMLPDGSTYGPIINRFLTMSQGQVLTRDLTQIVPAIAPAGDYNYYGKVGDYPDEVWDFDSFAFTKSASGDGNGSSGEWKLMGWEKVSVEPGTNLPGEFSLSQNYPNPFNAVTEIAFSLPSAGKIRLSLYDITGREVAVLIDEVFPQGEHSLQFNASDLSSGIYLYKLEGDNFSEVKKMIFLK